MNHRLITVVISACAALGCEAESLVHAEGSGWPLVVAGGLFWEQATLAASMSRMGEVVAGSAELRLRLGRGVEGSLEPPASFRGTADRIVVDDTDGTEIWVYSCLPGSSPLARGKEDQRRQGDRPPQGAVRGADRGEGQAGLGCGRAGADLDVPDQAGFGPHNRQVQPLQHVHPGQHLPGHAGLLVGHRRPGLPQPARVRVGGRRGPGVARGAGGDQLGTHRGGDGGAPMSECPPERRPSAEAH